MMIGSNEDDRSSFPGAASPPWTKQAGGGMRLPPPEPRADAATMPDTTFDTRAATTTKLERPKLYKVILVNDDYTPREFVVMVLKAEFKMGESNANAVMLTAHRKGSCVIAVYPRDVAETKADRATDLGRSRGFPLQFTTEPEE
jgi:ATP-dependent Clp protease adaptor protein ClpS